MIHTTLYERDFSKALVLPHGLNIRPEMLSWHAIGGCDAAEIRIEGGKYSVWEMVEMLRCPLTVWNGAAKAWWGYVNRVEVMDGNLRIGVSLDDVANRVRIVYSDIAGSGVTDWLEDTASSAVYGVKEWHISQMDINATTASSLRAAYLSQYKYPIPVRNIATRQARGSKKTTATLTCRGWWNTLDWRYSIVTPVAAIYYDNATGSTTQAVGSAEANTVLMQQITVGASNVYALGVKLLIGKVGSPEDELMIGLYELDKDGNPEGDSVATGSVYGPLLAGPIAWTDLWYSECQLRAGRKYGIRLGRSGDVDASNYYFVGVNAALGYSGGVMRLYNGEEWVARSTDADLLFSVFANAQVASTTQIASQVTAFGQFLTATDLESTSGITQGSYQDGSTTALRAIEDLLVLGKSGGRRYLADVTEERRLRVYEEPAVSNVPYRLGADDELRTALNVPVQLGEFPAGSWCKLMEAIPDSVDVSRMADPSLQFIEAVEWRPDSGMKPVFRGAVTPEEMLRVRR